MADSFELDREKHIVIDGKVYDRSALTEEHIRLISLVNYADQQIMGKTTDLDLYKSGRDEQVKALISSVADLAPIAEVSPEAAE